MAIVEIPAYRVLGRRGFLGGDGAGAQSARKAADGVKGGAIIDHEPPRERRLVAVEKQTASEQSN